MNDVEFAKGLVDGSQIIAVLLVFISVLFGIKYERIVEVLAEGMPDRDLADRKAAFRGRQWRCLRAHALPIVLPSVLLSALLAPACLRIASTSHLTFFDLDLVRTLFIVVELFALATAAWSVVVSVVLVMRAVNA